MAEWSIASVLKTDIRKVSRVRIPFSPVILYSNLEYSIRSKVRIAQLVRACD